MMTRNCFGGVVMLAVGLGACVNGVDVNVDRSALFGTIIVDGQPIERLAPPPVAPADQAAVDAFMGGFLAGAITDFRTAAAAEAAVDLAILDNHGDPVHIGDVAFVRPGIGNIMFSPAQIYLLSRHFTNVVVMYTNMTDPTGPTGVRAVTSLEGVPIPASIAGEVRIWAIGSPQLNIISGAQQSDVTLEQLEILRQNQSLIGFDPLGNKNWIFAHSQGVFDAVVTDHRLKEAHLNDFKRIVSVAGATQGGRLIGTPLGDTFVQGAEDAAGEQGRIAFEALEPSVSIANLIEFLDVNGAHPEDKQRKRVRRAVWGAFSGSVDPNLPQGNIRDAFLFLAAQPDFRGEVTSNDGVENLDSTSLGKRRLTFVQADHILMIEDPAILRAELEVVR
ncbi:MAG: hypothetical protein AB7P03_12280 [Kofleriaceae bacterium]